MRQRIDPTQKPKATTVAGAGHYTGLSESYIRLLIEQGKLPHIRAGRAIRLLIDDLDSFLMSRRQEAR